MKAKLVLADSARVHSDGTMSMLRGGITNTMVPKGQPPLFRGSIAATIVVELGEQGKHAVRIVCCDEDGKQLFRVEGGINAKETHFSATHIVFDISQKFPKFGRYTFVISVDGQQLDSWPLEIREASEDSPGGNQPPKVGDAPPPDDAV